MANWIIAASGVALGVVVGAVGMTFVEAEPQESLDWSSNEGSTTSDERSEQPSLDYDADAALKEENEQLQSENARLQQELNAANKRAGEAEKILETRNPNSAAPGRQIPGNELVLQPFNRIEANPATPNPANPMTPAAAEKMSAMKAALTAEYEALLKEGAATDATRKQLEMRMMDLQAQLGGNAGVQRIVDNNATSAEDLLAIARDPSKSVNERTRAIQRLGGLGDKADWTALRSLKFDSNPRVAQEATYQDMRYSRPVTGYLISSVSGGSQAEKIGLKKGDFITHYDGKDVTSVSVLTAAKNAIPEGGSSRITVYRDGSNLGFTITQGTIGVNGGVLQKK